MRILILCGSLNVSTGGPPRVVAGSATALAAIGYSVDIAALSEPSFEVEDILHAFPELQHDAISISLYPRSRPRSIGGSTTMRVAISRRISSYEAVHVHGIWEQCLADVAALARKVGVPVFVSAHGMLDPWSMRQSRLKKRLALTLFGTGRMLRGARAIVYGSEDELLESQNDTLGAKAVVVPNAIDVRALVVDNLPRKPDLATIFPTTRDWTRTVLYFSRIHPKKGLDLLVEAFKKVAPDHPGTGLLVVGIAQDQAYEDRIRTKIGESNVADRIVMSADLIGPGARVAFRKADIFALPSHQEGFSMAILEAMALKKPLLITDRCHLPEVSTDWDCGVVVGDTAQGVAEGLDLLLKMDEDSLARMGQRGRRAVEDNFSWEAIARQLDRLYCGQEF